MELNITDFFYKARTLDYQNSIANSGLSNIGEITWNKAKRDAKKYAFATDENRECLIDWLEGFGAWEREEMNAWTLKELNALMIQFVAGWVQEKENRTWEEYEKLSCAGQVSGCLFEDTEGNVFASVDC